MSHRRYQDVIVFIVGGGCYSEYYNLQVIRERGGWWAIHCISQHYLVMLSVLVPHPTEFKCLRFQLSIMIIDGWSASNQQLLPIQPCVVYAYQDLLKQKQSGGGGALRNIIYGCSELLSGDDFLKQLERLGATSAARWDWRHIRIVSQKTEKTTD